MEAEFVWSRSSHTNGSKEYDDDYDTIASDVESCFDAIFKFNFNAVTNDILLAVIFISSSNKSAFMMCFYAN
jgi:hypothetical protein